MRKLNFDDCLDFMVLIDNLKLKDEIKKISLNQKKEVVGFEFVWKTLIIIAGKKGRDELYEFLSGPFEMTVEEIRKMELTTLLESFKEIANMEEWRSFFNSLQQMT